MPVRCEEMNQVCVIAVDGDLDADNAAALRREADEHVDRRQLVDFVVDLEKCPFIDSEGLETLLWLKRRSEDLFGQLKLAALDDNVRKILQITRLEHRFACQDDLASALKLMR